MEFYYGLLILYYYSLFIHRFESVSARQKPLEIIENRKRVEELAVQHANHKRDWKNTRFSISKKIHKLKKNICDKEPNVKVEFCYRFLSMAYMGYTFDTWQENDLMCVENIFWITSPDNPETESFEMDMYPCPDIKYRDLETDKEVIISEKYYVSEGRKHRSAIVFFQEDEDKENDKIYPIKYINNIVFEELTSSQPDQDLQPILEPNVDPDVEIIRYGVARRIFKNPYQKFQQFFFSMNVCGLPKSHKIHLCRGKVRAINESASATLKLNVYDQYRCRKRRVRAPRGRVVYDREDMEIYLLLCPLTNESSESSDLKTIESLVYLSSTLFAFSVSSLTRYNNWGHDFEWRSVFYNVDIRGWVKDRRRLRKMKYPSEIEREEALMQLQRNELQEFETKVNWTVTSVQTPVIMAKSGSLSWDRRRGSLTPAQITRREPLVEDILISYSEIKAMKSTYERFRKTYSSLDICELPHKVQEELCDDILKQSPFEYYPMSDKEEQLDEKEQSDESFHSVDLEFEDTDYSHINHRCSRRAVNLGIREVDSLRAEYFSMWQCPKAETSERYTSVYHIAKYHLKNALILFKSSDAHQIEDIIFPKAVVTKIDRQNLARIVLSSVIAH